MKTWLRKLSALVVLAFLPSNAISVARNRRNVRSDWLGFGPPVTTQGYHNVSWRNAGRSDQNWNPLPWTVDVPHRKTHIRLRQPTDIHQPAAIIDIGTKSREKWMRYKMWWMKEWDFLIQHYNSSGRRAFFRNHNRQPIYWLFDETPTKNLSHIRQPTRQCRVCTEYYLLSSALRNALKLPYEKGQVCDGTTRVCTAQYIRLLEKLLQSRSTNWPTCNLRAIYTELSMLLTMKHPNTQELESKSACGSRLTCVMREVYAKLHYVLDMRMRFDCNKCSLEEMVVLFKMFSISLVRVTRGLTPAGVIECDKEKWNCVLWKIRESEERKVAAKCDICELVSCRPCVFERFCHRCRVKYDCDVCHTFHNCPRCRHECSPCKHRRQCARCRETHSCEFCAEHFGCTPCKVAHRKCEECILERGCTHCKQAHGCHCENYDCQQCISDKGCEYCEKMFKCQCRDKCDKCLQRNNCYYCLENLDCTTCSVSDEGCELCFQKYGCSDICEQKYGCKCTCQQCKKHNKNDCAYCERNHRNCSCAQSCSKCLRDINNECYFCMEKSECSECHLPQPSCEQCYAQYGCSEYCENSYGCSCTCYECMKYNKNDCGYCEKKYGCSCEGTCKQCLNNDDCYSCKENSECTNCTVPQGELCERCYQDHGCGDYCKENYGCTCDCNQCRKYTNNGCKFCEENYEDCPCSETCKNCLSTENCYFCTEDSQCSHCTIQQDSCQQCIRDHGCGDYCAKNYDECFCDCNQCANLSRMDFQPCQETYCKNVDGQLQYGCACQTPCHQCLRNRDCYYCKEKSECSQCIPESNVCLKCFQEHGCSDYCEYNYGCSCDCHQCKKYYPNDCDFCAEKYGCSSCDNARCTKCLETSTCYYCLENNICSECNILSDQGRDQCFVEHGCGKYCKDKYDISCTCKQCKRYTKNDCSYCEKNFDDCSCDETCNNCVTENNCYVCKQNSQCKNCTVEDNDCLHCYNDYGCGGYCEREYGCFCDCKDCLQYQGDCDWCDRKYGCACTCAQCLEFHDSNYCMQKLGCVAGVRSNVTIHHQTCEECKETSNCYYCKEKGICSSCKPTEPMCNLCFHDYGCSGYCDTEYGCSCTCDQCKEYHQDDCGFCERKYGCRCSDSCATCLEEDNCFHCKETSQCSNCPLPVDGLTCQLCLEHYDCDYCESRYGCSCACRDCREYSGNSCEYCERRYGCSCKESCESCLITSNCYYCKENSQCSNCSITVGEEDQCFRDHGCGEYCETQYGVSCNCEQCQKYSSNDCEFCERHYGCSCSASCQNCLQNEDCYYCKENSQCSQCALRAPQTDCVQCFRDHGCSDYCHKEYGCVCSCNQCSDFGGNDGESCQNSLCKDLDGRLMYGCSCQTRCQQCLEDNNNNCYYCKELGRCDNLTCPPDQCVCQQCFQRFGCGAHCEDLYGCECDCTQCREFNRGDACVPVCEQRYGCPACDINNNTACSQCLKHDDCYHCTESGQCSEGACQLSRKEQDLCIRDYGCDGYCLQKYHADCTCDQCYRYSKHACSVCERLYGCPCVKEESCKDCLRSGSCYTCIEDTKCTPKDCTIHQKDCRHCIQNYGCTGYCQRHYPVCHPCTCEQCLQEYPNDMTGLCERNFGCHSNHSIAFCSNCIEHYSFYYCHEHFGCSCIVGEACEPCFIEHGCIDGYCHSEYGCTCTCEQCLHFEKDCKKCQSLLGYSCPSEGIQCE